MISTDHDAWIDWEDIERRIQRGEVNSESVALALYKLAEIVVNKHFSHNPYHVREDLVSEGMTKALSLLPSCAFDKPVTSLKNYLYTAIRNECSGYLIRQSREIPMTRYAEEYEESGYDETTLLYGEIQKVFSAFEDTYKRYIPAVCHQLLKLGFNIEGLPDGGASETPSVENPRVLQRFTCLIVWKKMSGVIGVGKSV